MSLADMGGIGNVFGTMIMFLFSNVGSILVLVLETLILYKACISYCGFRFIPIYGEYYFYQSLIPEKKTLNLAYVVLNVVQGVFTVIAISVSSVNTINDNVAAVFIILSIILILCAALVRFIVGLMIKFRLAERFGYDQFMGIFFQIVPVIGDIMMLVHIDQYNGGYDLDDETF